MKAWSRGTSMPPVLVIASTTVRTAAQAAQSCGDISASERRAKRWLSCGPTGALPGPVPGQQALSPALPTTGRGA